MSRFYVICHIPVTGEQYLREFDTREEVEALLIEDIDAVGTIVEGVEIDMDDFIK